MEYILGVDGGGTKTTAQIADTEGNKISQHIAGPSNYYSVGIEKASDNLNEAVFGAADSAGLHSPVFLSSCFGFAGYNTELDRKSYEQIVSNPQLKPHLKIDKLTICNDTRVGLAAGSDSKNKAILISGTGANCYGINDKGMEAKANGWDYLLSDEGSGYSIGLRALKAVMRAYDGRGEETLLSETILAAAGVKNIAELMRWVHKEPFSKDRIGMFSKTVCEAANRGDKISQDILVLEAHEAEINVTAVIERLGLREKEFDLVLVGGNFKCKRFFKKVLTDGLEAKYKKINFMSLQNEPAYGAIKLAIENL